MIDARFLILFLGLTSRSFAHEFIVAARFDGLSEVNIFIPTMRSAPAAVVNGVAAWTTVTWPEIILINNSFQTMPMPPRTCAPAT